MTTESRIDILATGDCTCIPCRGEASCNLKIGPFRIDVCDACLRHLYVLIERQVKLSSLVHDNPDSPSRIMDQVVRELQTAQTV